MDIVPEWEKPFEGTDKKHFTYLLIKSLDCNNADLSFLFKFKEKLYDSRKVLLKKLISSHSYFFEALPNFLS